MRGIRLSPKKAPGPDLPLDTRLNSRQDSPQFAMALAAPAIRMASSSPFLPRLLPPALFSTTRIQLYLRQFSLPLFPSLALAVPAGFQLGLPSLPSILEGIWESILRAVPKKKTSHMKKRHRQMAGKALKDVTSLCKCPACGEIKRMHYLCPRCAASEQELDRTVMVSGC